MGIMEGSTKPSLFVHLKPYIPCYLRSKDIYTKIYTTNTAISSFNALFSNFYGGQNEQIKRYTILDKIIRGHTFPT